MNKVISIIGARPQFIKLAPLLEVWPKSIQHVIVHTGQHYDYRMSRVFFNELQIPKPKYHLGVGSGSHGFQTAEMLLKIEKILLRERPHLVIVYGDTNSTLAGALAASKLQISIAHIEAGMRSFNRSMPEEINRIVADHLATLNFCPTENAVKLLSAEGIRRNVFNVGDIMVDILKLKSKTTLTLPAELLKQGLRPHKYALLTIHRAGNVDNKATLAKLLTTLAKVKQQIIFPVHPRTKHNIATFGLQPLVTKAKNLKLIEPVGYREMLSLEANAKFIMTDSGGVQKEAYLFKTRCITLRQDTEWVETVKEGWNTLVGTDPKKILYAVRQSRRPRHHRNFLGHGQAGRKIVRIISRYLHGR